MSLRLTVGCAGSTSEGAAAWWMAAEELADVIHDLAEYPVTTTIWQSCMIPLSGNRMC